MSSAQHRSLMAGQAADSSSLGPQAVHLPSAGQATERKSAAASVGLALAVVQAAERTSAAAASVGLRASRAFGSHTWVGQPSAHKCPDLGRGRVP